MHILLLIVGAFGAAAFWWYRLKYMRDAAVEVTDAVGRIRGNVRRNSLRKKAALSPVTAINDPVTAAATIIIAIASEDTVISDALAERVAAEIRVIAESDEKAQEAVIYARWAANQIDDVGLVIDKTADLLKARLDEPEKEQLVQMVHAAAPAGERPAAFARRIDQLRRRLGLTTAR